MLKSASNISKLAILPWWTCDIACHHCVFSSSPKVSGKLPLGDSLKFIGEAAKYTGVKSVTISGGEAFIDVDYLLAISEKCNDLDLAFRIVTNGSIGMEPEKMWRALSQLKKNRLNSINLSWDQFHGRFLSPEGPKAIIESCKELSIPLQVTAVVTKESKLSDALSALGESAFDIPVVQVKALPIGRAQKKIRARDIIAPDAKNIGRACRNDFDTLTITHNSKIYPCCAVGGFTEGISLGTYKAGHLPEILHGLEHGVRFQALAASGPRHYASRMSEDSVRTLGISSCDHDCVTCNKIFGSSLGRDLASSIDSDVFEKVSKLTVTWPGS